MPSGQTTSNSAGKTEANKALIRKAMGALGHNDMRPLIEALDDRVVWKSHAPASHIRWGGDHADRGGILEMLAKLSSVFSFRKFEVDRIAAVGDEVWAVCDFEAFHPPTGRTVTGRNMLCATVKNGKLISYEGFFDTLSVLLQLGIEMPQPPR